MRLREVNEQQLDEIARLAKSIWLTHYVPIIGAKQVQYMLQKFYATDKLKEQIKQGQTFFFIGNEDSVIGFVAISQKTEKELFINKFYLLTTSQNKGFGTNVMKLIKSKYSTFDTITLTVNRQNFTAINFYFKNGFIIADIADFDIGEGYFMNDFIMRCSK